MNRMVEKRVALQRFYSEYSGYIDKVVKFLMAFLIFTYINQNVGFMKSITNPIVAVALSVICAILPAKIMVIMITAFTILQFYAALPGVAIVALLIFVMMYIFCFRMAPKQAIILVLMPLAFLLKIPMFVPIACGLLYTPGTIFPMVCGIIFYYMISYVEAYTAILEQATTLGIFGQITTYIQQFMGSSEMWLMCIAFVVCLLVVYTIRRTSVDNAWEIAAIAGSIVNMVLLLFISLDVNLRLTPVWVIVGTVISGVLGIFMEFFAFSLDYSRTENLQFEDDEYYYYVKAVPKITMAAPKKTVKRINERQGTRSMDVEAVREREKQEFVLDEQFPDDLDLQKLLEEELNK